MAASSSEPSTDAEIQNFVETVYKENENRGLTLEEQAILDEYFNDDGIGVIRKEGLRMFHTINH